MNAAFVGVAAFFDLLADGALKRRDKTALHRVADEYRKLDSDHVSQRALSRTRMLRFCAEECRTIAGHCRNEQCRGSLYVLAKTYDHLADSSEATDFLEGLKIDSLCAEK
jgi:hypothetical protein